MLRAAQPRREQSWARQPSELETFCAFDQLAQRCSTWPHNSQAFHANVAAPQAQVSAARLLGLKPRTGGAPRAPQAISSASLLVAGTRTSPPAAILPEVPHAGLASSRWPARVHSRELVARACAAGGGTIAAGQQSDHLIMVAAYNAWADALAKVCTVLRCAVLHTQLWVALASMCQGQLSHPAQRLLGCLQDACTAAVHPFARFPLQAGGLCMCADLPASRLEPH